MNNYIIGYKFKQNKADTIETCISPYLAKGEILKGIFTVDKINPLTDAVVITSMRLIFVRIANVHKSEGIMNEVAGNSVERIEAVDSKWTGDRMPLRAFTHSGQELKLGNIRKEDKDNILMLAKQMKGNPLAIPAAVQKSTEREAELEIIKNDEDIARKAEIIRAFEKPENQRTAREKTLLETAEGKEFTRKSNEALVYKHEASQKTSDTDREGGRCPKCKSDNLQAIQEVSTKGVSTSASAAGCCFLGPLGLLCGLPGAGKSTTKTMRMCLNCGKKF